MAASADGAVNISFTGNLKNTLTDGTVVPATIGNEVKVSLQNGTGANQFNRGWKKHEWTLADAATVNLDMYALTGLDIGAGAGEDPLGLTQQNTELVGLIVQSKDDSVGSLMIGAEGSAAAWQSMFHISGTLNDTAGFKLLPGATLAVVAPKSPGYAIANTTNHLLKFAAAGGVVNFHVDLFLRGAA